jgi:hypothetical protein
MPLSLKESSAARELPKLLYSFLPGSGSRQWKGHISFKSIAEKVGVGEYWGAGSKEPMIAQLIENTLQYRRGRFEALIIEIVRAGLTYRRKQGTSHFGRDRADQCTDPANRLQVSRPMGRRVSGHARC